MDGSIMLGKVLGPDDRSSMLEKYSWALWTQHCAKEALSPQKEKLYCKVRFSQVGWTVHINVRSQH